MYQYAGGDVKNFPSGTEVARPFLPARDFEISKRFYEALGLRKTSRRRRRDLPGRFERVHPAALLSGGLGRQFHDAAHGRRSRRVVVAHRRARLGRNVRCPASPRRPRCSRGAFERRMSSIRRGCSGTSPNGAPAHRPASTAREAGRRPSPPLFREGASIARRRSGAPDDRNHGQCGDPARVVGGRHAGPRGASARGRTRLRGLIDACTSP